MNTRKVFVLGLDCATPQLVFDQYRDQLPNFRRLMEAGAWGKLRSSDPPITVPAWACMFSGRDAGELGFYGFRNRADYSYDKLSLANSRAVKVPRIWDVASEAGQQVVVLGVPQTFPVNPVKGVMVSSFLTPSKESNYTYPALVKWELDRLAGGGKRAYMIDVENFRTDDKERLLADIHEMTRRRFRVVRAWMDQRKWDLFCMVEMGPDRLHHGFWRYCDREHRLFQPGNPFENALLDYYKVLDEELGSVIERLPEGATLLVVSDHGARGMEGGVCINEWLIQQGLLTVKEYPSGTTAPLKYDNVVWEKTKVWGEGGYYGRVFLNIEGREPQGVIPAAEAEAFREELIRRIEAIPDIEGKPMPTRALKPNQLYKTINGVAPDLFVYFGDLAWRSVGSLGHRAIHILGNDTGPDDANHDYNGIFLGMDEELAGRGELQGLTLFDIYPTLASRLGLPIPEGLTGKII